MKILFKIVLLSALTIMAVTCKKSITSADFDDTDTLSSPDTSRYYSVSGIVLDVVSSDYSPGVKKGAPVYIDQDSAISGDDGRFIFHKIKEGKHIISASLPDYIPYSETISVMKDTAISIYLYGNKGDYLPVQGDTQKKFKYTSSSSNGVSSMEDTGESTWKIYSFQQIGDSKVYKVDETVIFTRRIYSPLYSERLDTSYSSFTISENSSYIITFQSSILDGVSLNRYWDARLGETVTKSFYNPGSLISTVTVSLKKNVGIYKITQSGNRWGKTYELTQ